MDQVEVIEEFTRVPEVLVFCTTFLFVYLVVNRVSEHYNPDLRKQHPPSIGCLPIIGSLPYLPSLRNIHHWSLEKSYKLGGVFTFKFGKTYVVLLNSHDAIREAFTKRSSDFAGRIKHFIDPIFNLNGKGIVFASYNEEFKKYHQISLSILKEFGFGKNLIEARVHTEVEELLNNIKAMNNQPFCPREKIEFAVQSIISRISYGSSEGALSEVSERSLSLILKFPAHFMNMLPLDILPSLRFVPYFKKQVNEVKEITREAYQLITKQIMQSLGPNAEESFVSHFVEKEGKDYDKPQLMVTLRDLVVAGTDTITATIMWSMIFLANHPEVQERVQKDIDSVVARDRLPSLSDASMLIYVEATVLEIMRIKSVLPFGVPRRTLRDTQVGGYFIPKDSHVFSMLHSVHMDVNVWTDPEVFRPERFIDLTGNIINKDLVIPFSLGKRSCLGESLARQEVFLFLTGLVQQFNIRPPEGSDKVEHAENMDGVLSPKPYQVRFLTRH